MLVHSDYSLIPRQIASAGPAGGFYTYVALAVLALAFLIAIKAWFHDRSKGRARCRHCWYRLPHDPLAPCPECGCKPKKPAHLYRTRRSKRWMLVALLVALAAGSVWYWPHVQYRKQTLGETTTQALVPTTYMIWAVPHTDQKQWLILCYRVSGKSSGQTNGSGQLVKLPGSGLDRSRLVPSRSHIGYALPPTPALSQHGFVTPATYSARLAAPIWAWQGRMLLDKLLVVALDDQAKLATRKDAYHLYGGYSEFCRIEHFQNALPLLRGKYAEDFAYALGDVGVWPDEEAGDPRVVENELVLLSIEAPEFVVDRYNILPTLALTGNTALDTVEELWASDDPIIRHRGTQILDILTYYVVSSLNPDSQFDRNELDAKKLVELLGYGANADDLDVAAEWAEVCVTLEYLEENSEGKAHRVIVNGDIDVALHGRDFSGDYRPGFEIAN